jgi:hypothetical protein
MDPRPVGLAKDSVVFYGIAKLRGGTTANLQLAPMKYR